MKKPGCKNEKDIGLNELMNKCLNNLPETVKKNPNQSLRPSLKVVFLPRRTKSNIDKKQVSIKCDTNPTFKACVDASIAQTVRSCSRNDQYAYRKIMAA